MGIGSCIKKIENQRFVKMPDTLSLKTAKKAIYRDGDMYVLRDDGAIATTNRLVTDSHIVRTGTGYAPVQAMVLFGVITEKEAYEHGSYCREYDYASRACSAAQSAAESLELIGIKLTPSQKRQLTNRKKQIAKAKEEKRIPYSLTAAANKVAHADKIETHAHFRNKHLKSLVEACDQFAKSSDYDKSKKLHRDIKRLAGYVRLNDRAIKELELES